MSFNQTTSEVNSVEIAKWSISDITKIDSPRTLFQNIYEFVFGVVRGARLLDPDPDVMRSMKQDVIARVEALCPGPYDLVANLEDRLYEERIAGIKKTKSEYEIAERNYAKRVIEAKDQFAVITPDNEAPEPSVVLVVAAVIILAVGFTFTAYDYLFFQVNKELLRGLFSLIFAGAIGALLIWGILVDAPKTSLRTVKNRLALAVGIVVSITTSLLRAVHAQNRTQAVFALCLGVLEVGVLFIIEAHASNLRAQANRYAEAKSGIKVLEDAEKGLDRCRSEIKQFDAEIAEHGRYVALRGMWSRQISAMKQAADQAVESAFMAAILQNRAEYLP